MTVQRKLGSFNSNLDIKVYLKPKDSSSPSSKYLTLTQHKATLAYTDVRQQPVVETYTFNKLLLNEDTFTETVAEPLAHLMTNGGNLLFLVVGAKNTGKSITINHIRSNLTTQLPSDIIVTYKTINPDKSITETTNSTNPSIISFSSPTLTITLLQSETPSSIPPAFFKPPQKIITILHVDPLVLADTKKTLSFPTKFNHTPSSRIPIKTTLEIQNHTLKSTLARRTLEIHRQNQEITRLLALPTIKVMEADNESRVVSDFAKIDRIVGVYEGELKGKDVVIDELRRELEREMGKWRDERREIVEENERKEKILVGEIEAITRNHALEIQSFEETNQELVESIDSLKKQYSLQVEEYERTINRLIQSENELKQINSNLSKEFSEREVINSIQCDDDDEVGKKENKNGKGKKGGKKQKVESDLSQLHEDVERIETEVQQSPTKEPIQVTEATIKPRKRKNALKAQRLSIEIPVLPKKSREIGSVDVDALVEDLLGMGAGTVGGKRKLRKIKN